jgi:hypothetical protein
MAAWKSHKVLGFHDMLTRNALTFFLTRSYLSCLWMPLYQYMVVEQWNIPYTMPLNKTFCIEDRLMTMFLVLKHYVIPDNIYVEILEIELSVVDWIGLA